MSKNRTRRAAVLAAAAALAVLPVAPAAAAGETEVVVVHGVPGVTVDVLVDGAAAITDFQYGSIVKVVLPSKSYKIDIVAAGTTGPAVLSGTFALPAGASVTLAAHLTAGANGIGTPTLKAYVNQRGGTGIQPFHLANFGAVDVLAGGSAALKGVTNGQTARIDVPGGTSVPGVGLAAAGSTTAALSLGTVTVPEGVLILAYAIGDANDLQVITEVIPVSAVPHSVPSGLAPSVPGTTVLALALALVAAGLMVPAVASRRG